MSLIAYPNALKYREQATDPWSTATIFAKADLESLADKFDTTETYTEGEIVLYQGGMYKCKAGGAGPGAWDATEWDQTTVEAELAALQTEVDSVKNTLTQLKTDTFGNINLTGTNNTGSTITAGTFFYNNGSLVKAKTNIQDGSSITIGTNSETVTAGGLNDFNTVEEITLNASDMTLPAGVTLHGTNKLYRVGKICIVYVSVKITSATVGNSKSIGNYLPYNYRPSIEMPFPGDTGLGDGKYQSFTLSSGGLCTFFPVNSGTTYVIGTAVYFRS